MIPNTRIKNFIKNPAVIGAYAENAVRSFVKGIVDPLKVSTGAVIASEMVDAKEKIPQIDTIIWQPNPFPGIFRSGDFALIPRKSFWRFRKCNIDLINLKFILIKIIFLGNLHIEL